ncbi:MAG: methionine adenosyltransferase [Alphaproteobacteria bacterium]|nr:MAG: methionine adenosyltransferase [Alphaproteobacteria bacterium]
MNEYIFTSESVSEGHPDKICDRVSDSIVDLFLEADPEARVAAETMAFTDTLVIAGETRGPDSVTPEKIEAVARQAVKDIGYAQDGFHHETLDIQVKLVQQSPDIAQGVDIGRGVDKEEGAGDQGIMFGYACRETDALMPAAIHHSHAILRKLAQLRHDGTLGVLGPDAKSQVSLVYKDGTPLKTSSIVLSTQHDDGLSQADIYDLVKPVIEEIIPDGWMCSDDELYINPTGRFVIGGPVGDCGLTGRKIIVDTYGGAAPHGGGAFSGKDPTKVDRSAAYAARYLAKNVVAANLADKCTIQLSYAIGVSKPISVYVDTHGTGKADSVALSSAIQKCFDLSPRGIRTHLGLNKPIYTPSSSYGHFGRTPTNEGHFSWEKTDLIDALHNAL